MLITSAGLEAIFQGYSFIFNEGFNGAKSHAFDIAMKVPSEDGENIYPWLGAFPQLREWIGDRVLNSLQLHGFKIKNRKFESTVAVKREEIEDDRYGVLKPLFSEMGRATRLHPDKLVFELLQKGTSTICYDGQNFFDTNHPVLDENDKETFVSNVYLAEVGPAPFWYLLDTTKFVKPLIFQERIPYTFQSVTDDRNERVFLRDEYVYGVRARVNAGFGLWQLAYASNLPLNQYNYAYARNQMMKMRNDRGHVIGVEPNLLVVGPYLEASARRLLKATSIGNIDAPTTGATVPGVAETNIWYQSADLIVTPFLP
ncbi:MAG: hypothetical protein C3F11_01630 [Methylocystaceae bacterium]|nr:MAG: hypothetical protein C3F11_01630 [Methylocystaceae bacterium]